MRSPLYQLIQKSEACFDFVQDHGYDGIILLNSITNEIWANARLADVLGYKEDIPPAILNRINKTHLEKKHQDIDILSKSGRSIAFKVSTFQQDTFQILGLQQKTKNIDQIDQRILAIRSLLTSAKLAFWEWNIQTGEVYLSPFWAQELGYRMEELQPFSVSTWSELAHPDDAKKCERLLQEHFDGHSLIYESEARMRHRNGRLIWVYDQGKVVSWKDDQPEWMIGFHQQISERKNQEEVLKTFIRQFPAAVAMTNKSLDILSYTQEWLEEFHAGQELSVSKIAESIPHIPAITEGIERIINNEIPIFEEIIREENSFQDNWREWKITPWYDQQHIGGVIIQVSNLNKLKKLELEKLQYFQYMAMICANLPVAMIACDTRGRLTLYNDTAREWFHLNESAEIGEPQFIDHIQLNELSGDQIFTDHPLRKLLRNEEVKNRQFTIQNDQYKRTLKADGIQLFNELGEIIGVAMTLYDMSDSIATENQLRLSEQTFKNSFKKAPIGMALVDLDGSWMRVNSKICKILGYSKEELLKTNFQQITHPDDLDSDLYLLNEVKLGKRKSYELEKRYIHKTGKIVSVILSVSVVRDPQKNPLFYISQLTDISSLKASSEALKNALEITQKQNDRLHNFAHIVSHNLRSHTGNISMLLDLLLSQYDQLRQEEIPQMLLTASKQLNETISHLNEVATLHDTNEDELESLGLSSVIEKELHNINAYIKETKIKIENKVAPDVKVLVIPAYLESIIFNFVTNAIKYRSLDRAPKLSFRSKYINSFVMLEIQDNGLGIDLEKHGHKLFGMYKTFHKHKEARGIGLFITKNQIEAMGGKIEVESTPNIGTTFKIFLKHA